MAVCASVSVGAAAEVGVRVGFWVSVGGRTVAVALGGTGVKLGTTNTSVAETAVAVFVFVKVAVGGLGVSV